MAIKKGMTTNFFSPISFVAVFGSGINIPDPQHCFFLDNSLGKQAFPLPGEHTFPTPLSGEQAFLTPLPGEHAFPTLSQGSTLSLPLFQGSMLSLPFS